MTVATVAMAIFVGQQTNISNRQTTISETQVETSRRQAEISNQQYELDRKVNEAQIALGFDSTSKVVWFKNYGKITGQNIKAICQHMVVTHDTVLARKKTSTEIKSLFPDEIPVLQIEMAENASNNAEFLLCIWTYEGNATPRTREYVMPGSGAWVLTTQSKVNPEQWKMIEQEYKRLEIDLISENQAKPVELNRPKS